MDTQSLHDTPQDASGKVKDSPKHTPGPWIASQGAEDEPERWVVLQDIHPDYRYHIATVENGAPGDTLKTEGVNARLIAAAPAMHEALTNLVARIDEIEQHPQHKAVWTSAYLHGDIYHNGPNWKQEIDDARAALALATSPEGSER